MATFYKRAGKRGIRWTARVRIAGREVTRTWATKAAAEAWARSQETAIDKGEYFAPRPGSGALLADVIDEFVAHRAVIRRPPGTTFANALERLKKQHGLEPLGNLDVAFWRRHALDRIAKGRSGSTVASDLAYAGSVLRHAAREGHSVNADAPGAARTKLREDGVEVISRQRTRRITDAELDRLFAWIDANAERTSLPLRDLVEFALATGMRRGEILALEWTDIAGRVANIKRKHPLDPNRREDVPLLKRCKTWPKVDPLKIIERQPKTGRRVFPYLGDTLGFWFEEALKGAEIDGAVFHLLRHECLSRLAKRGFDPLRLAMIGGHRDLKSVKRYAKLDAEGLANE
jgi:integrase